MRQIIVAGLAILIGSVALATCFAPRWPWSGPAASGPGPIPLRSLEQLETYMVRTWRGPVEKSAYRPTPPEDDPPANCFWQFRDDGTFIAWVDDPVGGEGIFDGDDPDSLVRYAGRWSVSYDIGRGLDSVRACDAEPGQLHLTQVTPSPPGSDDGSITLPLRWIDGKFRIEIDGKRFFVHSLN